MNNDLMLLRLEVDERARIEEIELDTIREYTFSYHVQEKKNPWINTRLLKQNVGRIERLDDSTFICYTWSSQAQHVKQLLIDYVVRHYEKRMKALQYEALKVAALQQDLKGCDAHKESNNCGVGCGGCQYDGTCNH